MTLAHRRVAAPAGRRDVAGGERGAVLVLVAVCLTVLVTATAFTVDLGRISTTRRDAQLVADAAALDLSRQLDGRTAAAIVADPAWAAGLDATLARNGFERIGEQGAVAALGSWDVATETFTPAMPDEVPTAVQVRATGTVDYGFAPGGAATTRTAVATNGAVAGHSVGSFAARLDSSSSPLLAALLDDALGVTAGGYDGLVDGQVRVGELVDELDLDLGDPDALLAAQVKLADLLAAEAEVLRRGGDLARAEVVEAVRAQLDHPDAPVALGELLVVGTGAADVAAAASIDALELLAASALVANGDRFLEVPGATVEVAGQAVALDVRAQVVERPRWAFGPVGTVARTAQVRLEVGGVVALPGVSTTTFSLVLSAASGTASSAGVTCGDPQALDLDVASGLVDARIELASRLAIGSLEVADVALSASVDEPSATVPTDFVLPPDAYGEAVAAPLPAVDLGTASVATDRVDVLGLPADVLLAPLVDGLVSTVVDPLLDAVQGAVVAPLADLLGLSVAGVDVVPLAVGCAGPRLVG